MIVKSQKSVFVIVAGLLVLVVLSSAAQIPDILRFPDKYSLRDHVKAFLETNWDLAHSKEANFQDYGWGRRAFNWINTSLITGTYPVEMDDLRIDIKFKHWLKLNKDRNRALQKSILRKANWVPVKINFQNQKLKAKLRLKGSQGEHWTMPKRWSFRIKIKDGASIKGFSQFSLQRPAARQFPSDQLYHFWHQSIGGLSPNFRFARVYVNGDYWGIMLMEEHVNKSMLELNKKKEAPLFKLNSDAGEGDYYHSANRNLKIIPEVFYAQREPVLYSANKYSENDRILRLYSYVLSQFRQFNRNGIDAQTLLDHEAFARSLILTSVWGSGHTLGGNNSRFYLNPYTLLVEPINTDQTRYRPITHDSSRKPDLAGVFGSAIKSDAFNEIYNRVYRDIKKTLPSLSGRHQELCTNFPLDCPSFDPEILKKNMVWVDNIAKPAWFSLGERSRENPVDATPADLSLPGPANPNDPGDDGDVDYPEHIIAEHYDDGTLRIYNLLPRPVNITQIKLTCTKRSKKSCRPQELLNEDNVLEGSTVANHLYFEAWKTPVHDLGKQQNIEIVTERKGRFIEYEIPFTLRTDIKNPLLLNRQTLSDFGKPDWLTLDGKTAYVEQGTWSVNSPVILPVGVNLHIPAGTTFHFSSNAYLIIRGAIMAEGQKNNPIVFAPQEETWKGLYVLNASETSRLSHVQIRGTDFLVDGVLDLTGGVTFYRSDVDISDTVFSDSMAEDALNIVHSDYTITDTIFLNSRSDAFDSDFSNGTVKSTKFHKSGGDGIDLSGSVLEASDVDFAQIKDKAISVGEKSVFRANTVAVTQSGSAIVSKDGSESFIDGLRVTAPQGYAAMAYVKKSVYGTALLEITNSNLEPKDVQNQTGNALRLDGLEISSGLIDVDALYNSEQMKK